MARKLIRGMFDSSVYCYMGDDGGEATYSEATCPLTDGFCRSTCALLGSSDGARFCTLAGLNYFRPMTDNPSLYEEEADDAADE